MGGPGIGWARVGSIRNRVGGEQLAKVAAGIGDFSRATLAQARRRPLEATAIVLMGLGGLIFPPVWLLGAALTLFSKHWDFRDRWVGLAGRWSW